jgi:23S rRNA (adenine2503-C2)-methyltransferase
VTALREASEAQGSEGDALKPLDAVADRLAHPLDLALSTFVDGELDLSRGDLANQRRGGGPVVELEPVAQQLERTLAHRGIADDRPIGLGHLEGGVSQPVCELAVVREEDEPGGIGVQATDGIEAFVGVDHVDHRRPTTGIARRGDDACRLVERVDDPRVTGYADLPPVDPDVACVDDVARRVAHDLAAHRHAPGRDDRLGFAPRGDAGVREVLGEAHEAATIGAVMDLARLDAALDATGEPAYRARQVWRWAAQGASGYEAMTNLPASLRQRLKAEVPFSSLELKHEAHASDGTVKALFHTQDGRAVEAVLMRYRDGRRSVCVSSQSGCPLTCTFCATGAMKFGRNLTQSEILDQVLHFRRIEAVDHLVFMGMGEPMMNLDSVLAASRRLPATGITHRRTGISTVGWVPGIRRLTDCDLPIRLALSLHAPEDTLRSELMPVNDRYSIDEVLAACEAFYERRRRQVFVEYLMLAGVNDSPTQAQGLAGRLDSRIYKVNLIPYNPTGSIYEGSSPEAIEAFRAALEDHGLRATVRLTRGRDIDAACGQLAARAAAA